jgi:signal transduction histidine kinase
VAYRWRIRHKLLLGFGLVLSIMGVLLAGTLKGLLSYNSTVKSIESKTLELSAAKQLMDQMAALNVHLQSAQGENGGIEEKTLKDLKKDGDEARTALETYEGQLRETLQRHRDPNRGYNEKEYVKVLRSDFDNLQSALSSYSNASIVSSESASDSRIVAIRNAVKELSKDAGDLNGVIHDSIHRRIKEAKSYYSTSMIAVLTASGIGVILMVSLLRFLYGWVFYPIRDLDRGARWVAQGDFHHRIEVHSGDEMEDLAATFNYMTGRLDEMYRDLEHQVNERSRQLVRSERLASVGFLAAGVAHEINNPLASIAFCSEALESRLANLAARSPDEGEVIVKYLKMIQNEAFRCKDITGRLLEFSRTGERRREWADLGEIIQSVVDMVKHLPNSRGKEIHFECDAAPKAWVNAQEIKSVVLNLVINALDSMDDGGTLTISIGEHEGMAELVFTDTGCGMLPEVLDNIFEPFFTRSRTGKGTGLGLSISHRIISQHGGEIEASSPGPSQGSTFTVRLPSRPAECDKEELLDHAAA